jgi:small subunit ribosomal protein S13
MARIMGIDLPKSKKVKIGLTYVYGIGLYSSIAILKEADIDPEKRVFDLTDDETRKITSVINDGGLKVEGDLHRIVSQNVKRLMEINTYRGLRHKRHLPCRGQRTKTNSRTRRKVYKF